MTDHDAVLARVRKLLAKAEHPSTPPAEAEVFSGKAAELIARYAIDAALLADAGGGAGEPVSRVVTVIPPYALPKAVLLGSVAGAHRVRMVLGNDLGPRGRRCTLVGFPVDLDLTELLFTSLLLQATSAVLAEPPVRRGLKAYRRAFLLGFASGVAERLRETEQRVREEAVSQSASTALVLASREDRVAAVFEAAFPRLRSIRPQISHGGGLAAGVDAGLRADTSIATPTLRGA